MTIIQTTTTNFSTGFLFQKKKLKKERNALVAYSDFQKQVANLQGVQPSVNSALALQLDLFNLKRNVNTSKKG